MAHRRSIDSEAPFPNFLKDWREFRGLKQAEVEKEFGWPAARVSHLETGNATITDTVLAKLAQRYDCTPGDLISRPPSEISIERPSEEAIKTGISALREALLVLARLTNQTQALREETKGRLDVMDRDIAAASQNIADAQRQASLLVEMLQAFSGMPEPASKEPTTNPPRNDAVNS